LPKDISIASLIANNVKIIATFVTENILNSSFKETFRISIH